MRRLPDPPFRAAILAPTWLGDSVMATALLPPLRKLSGMAVEVWARPPFVSLFSTLPEVGRVLPFAPKAEHRGPSGLLAWRRLVSEGEGAPDLICLIPDSLSAAAAAFVSGTRTRIGRRGDGRSFLLSHALPGGERKQRHWIEEQADLLAPLTGRGDSLGELSPRVAPDPAASARLDDLCAAAGCSASECIVLVAGATYGVSKRWPYFAALADSLGGKGMVTLVGAKGDRPTLSLLRQELRGAETAFLDLSEKLDLPQLADLMRRARCTIANDTGPMHLGAAAGGRVLGLFASTSPTWTAPRGPQARWLNVSLDCSPCFQKNCARGDLACMPEISLDRVLGAVGDWL